MCGIFAAIAPKGHPPCRFAPRAVELLKHRGPDAQGTSHVDLPWASVTLGMSRLKVVDQTDISVPFDFREDVSIVLAYNGEIYNWRELRASLGRLEWRTECDAELLAWLWRTRGGPKCLDKLNGMFAFVLVDMLTHEIHIVRDRAGEKPLYWTTRGDVTYFASEPKALPVALRAGACPDMAVLEFDCGRTTPFDAVQAVQPGHHHLLRPDEHITHVWWALPTDPPTKPLSVPKVNDLVHEVKELFVDAAALRHVAERKVAIQLSGGLDSAMTQTAAKCQHPYCVTFGDELDNLTAAKSAAASMGAPSAEVPAVVPVTFTKDDLLEVLPKVAYYLDTPATWTAVCQWFLNKKIAEDGEVVVLSGEGADELFSGYARYRILHWLDAMRADPHLATYGPLIERTFDGPPARLLACMLDRSSGEDRVRAEYLVAAHGGQGSLVDRMARVDFYTTMQALVRMADRMSAAFGLENRSPFFDYRLMELSARIPSCNKVTEHESKTILRQAARALGVSWTITDEQTKRGLTVPASWGDGKWDREWFRDEMLKAWRNACLRPALCESCT